MIRILTLNIWHGCVPRSAFAVESLEPPGNKERRLAALLDELRALDPDVICFQECMPQPQLSKRLAQALGYDLATKICNSGLRLFGLGFPPGIGGGEGVSLLAKPKLAMRPLGARRLSGIGFTSSAAALQLGQLRFALAAEVRVDGKPLVVVSTHLRYAYPEYEVFHRAWAKLVEGGHAQGEPSKTLVSLVHRNIRIRDAEVDGLMRFAAEWTAKGIPVAIGADLNLDPDASQIQRALEVYGLVNVLPAVGERLCTWDPAGNPNIAFSTGASYKDGTPKPLTHRLIAEYDGIAQCPDHLLLGPTFTNGSLRGGGVALDKEVGGVFPSDHYGIYADVAL